MDLDPGGHDEQRDDDGEEDGYLEQFLAGQHRIVAASEVPREPVGDPERHPGDQEEGRQLDDSVG